MYLERHKHHLGWMACHDIPRSVQTALGKTRFRQSLKTRSRAIALIRGATLEAKWRAAIEAARKGSGAALEDHAAWYRQAYKDASSPAERETILSEVTDRAADIAQREDGVPYYHAQPGEDPEQRPGYQQGLKLIGLVTGDLIKFDHHLDEYLGRLKTEAKSQDLAKSTIKKLSTEFPYIADLTRKAVQQWINRQAKDKTSATIRRQLSEVRGYWKYLVSIEAAPDGVSPFEKLSLTSGGKAAKRNERRPFTPADVLQLLDEAKNNKDTTLADLIELAMWTGARIEELCSLKVEKVDLTAGYIEVVDAKTSAGWRQIPVHSKLRPTLTRLVEANKAGFVLSGLTANKYGDRSNAIGKRFSRMKTELKFGSQFVFHSIRRTVATLLENAGVMVNIAADILGHEKPGITFGLYSGGNSLAVKQAAIEKISY